MLLASSLLAVGCPAGAGEPPGFTGRVALEVVDGIELDHKLRLLEDFSYRDETGRVWTAPRGGILDGTSVPREFRAQSGLPFEGDYRKASVLYDYHAHARLGAWREVDRLLHSASVHEGIAPPQANLLYAVVYAAAWRWEPRESSCYKSCHAAASMLAWRPDVTPAELQPVLDWLREANPTLGEIDRRVDAAIKRPGPHLFVQVR